MLRLTARTTRLAGAALAVALAAAACGSSSNKPNTSKTTGTTAPALPSATLNGSGSTFQLAYDQTAIAKFKAAHPGVTINYAGGGSGKGRTDLAGQIVDFAGTDALPKAADLPTYKGGPLLYFPTVAAPITVSYNLSGVSSVKLSADTLAKIFQAQVTTWNDPAITAENSGASLPSTKITVVHRADSSGTTQNFTKFLNVAAPTTWKLGTNSTVNWPAGTQAASGNTGVAQAVKTTNGAIGYVDYSDAKATSLSYASIKNKAGNYVKASLDSAKAALTAVTPAADLSYDPINADGADAYPITSPTWIMIYKTQTDHAKGTVLKAFLAYILSSEGQALAAPADYASLPSSILTPAQAQLNQIVVP
jgi:phosphate transport system substrate-binding protein